MKWGSGVGPGWHLADDDARLDDRQRGGAILRGEREDEVKEP